MDSLDLNQKWIPVDLDLGARSIFRTDRNLFFRFRSRSSGSRSICILRDNNGSKRCTVHGADIKLPESCRKVDKTLLIEIDEVIFRERAECQVKQK